ncbi:histidine phosphatase family protein [Clostridiaceae bacterium M8S5]|nr:histidine phosphatase family protein [Clostridiaceae bacterium M8S5]
MKLILVRHIETKANYEQKYIGHTHSQITQRGYEQIEKLVKKLKKYEFDNVYTSPMYRAKAIGERLAVDKELIQDDRLKELNFGVFEGLSYKQAKEQYKDIWNNWTNDYINYTLPKGENLLNLQYRVEDFVKSLKEGIHLIITHGGVIQSFLTYLLGIDIDKRWHFKIGLGTIIEIEYDNNYAIIESIDRLV